ncbi:MAG: ketoacyl-ACP synthase III [Bacteroidales bacterium]|nr:ketoacyl-ACP synthase III [Bacteroidales bacterium]MCL2133630.1 ketoacyl-ACP synthase III [Bacteroidales bacterium]
MTKITAAITAIAGYVPEYILTNEELSRIVDTSDEWITTRTGIKERHILKAEHEGSSYMGAKAVEELLRKTNTRPEDIDMLVCCTVTPDHVFPATANIICDKIGILNAWGFDMNAGCSGFLFTLSTLSQFIKTGRAKKVILVAAEKMSSITDYTDRNTCPLFGDAAVAMMIEPNTEGLGLIDDILHVDGIGRKFLYMKAGGSCYPPTVETVENREHCVYQDGKTVFKYAVSNMADTAAEIMERHQLTANDIAYLIPHQANLRIIDATGKRMGLTDDKVLINIAKYGNTSAVSIPLVLMDFEKQFKKGDILIFAAFGAGFTWGAHYYKWAY